MKNELPGSTEEGVMVTLLVGNLATLSRSCCSVVRQEKFIFYHGRSSDEMEIRKKKGGKCRLADLPAKEPSERLLVCVRTYQVNFSDAFVQSFKNERLKFLN